MNSTTASSAETEQHQSSHFEGDGGAQSGYLLNADSQHSNTALARYDVTAAHHGHTMGRHGIGSTPYHQVPPATPQLFAQQLQEMSQQLQLPMQQLQEMSQQLQEMSQQLHLPMQQLQEMSQQLQLLSQQQGGGGSAGVAGMGPLQVSPAMKRGAPGNNGSPNSGKKRRQQSRQSKANRRPNPVGEMVPGAGQPHKKQPVTRAPPAAPRQVPTANRGIHETNLAHISNIPGQRDPIVRTTKRWPPKRRGKSQPQMEENQ